MREPQKVALVIDTTLPISRELLRGIVQYANTQGQWLFFHERHEFSSKALQRVQHWGPDGMIIRARKIPPIAQTMKIPVIANSHVQSPTPNVVNLMGDDMAIGYMGADHFYKKGFRNYAFFGIRHHWAKGRCKAFSGRLTELGQQVHLYESSIRQFKIDYKYELSKLGRWLRRLPKPLALMIPSDDCGQYVTEACKLAEIMVPNEIAILGVHNDDIVCNTCFPPLSSIAMDSQRAGYDCARLLDQMMSNPNGRFQKTLPIVPTHVVTRQSSDIMAISEQDTLAALAFIHGNSDRIIQVGDVARHVGLSSRSLQRKFTNLIGHSIHQEITLSRIEFISRALIQTDLTISEITHSLGYHDISNFSRYFKKIKGLCPRDYRRKHLPATL